MIKTTTHNEVILNIYKETSETEQKDFQNECLINSMLSNEKEEFEAIKTSLDALSFQPKGKSIDAILQYSASFMSLH